MKQEKSNQINIILNEIDLQEKQNFVSQSQEISLSFIDKEFSQLIGLYEIKSTLQQIYAMKKMNEKRIKYELKPSQQVYHMLFTGNPGTGKTTVARKLANIFLEMNVLKKGHIIEVDRSALVGEYIGQTAQKTKNIIKRALGGVLFIDEAYSLARGGEKDFGKEAIDTLVKYMEDFSNEFILILAGYPQEMNYFLQQNPGLQSRFPFLFHFPNYTDDELIEIAKCFLKESEYKLSLKAEEYLKNHLHEQIIFQNNHFSNGRYVRNILEKAIRNHAMRIIYQEKEYNRKNLSQIKLTDLHFL
ncbi:MAG TPA: AAA family ATPase [Bacillota bacterium]|nr:AAA family ATPase [Bacillota bacterium]